MINPYRIGRGPGYQRPPQVSHSREPVEIMLLLNIAKTKGEKERRKASEEATGSVERESLTHKGRYLKNWNNDWKGKRAGRLDGAKECKPVSAYAPQVNNSMEEKKDFWEDLDGLIKSVSKQERIFLGADLSGHMGEGNIGDEEIMGRYGAGTRNREGSMIVDFAKRMDLAIVNTYFKKMNTG